MTEPGQPVAGDATTILLVRHGQSTWNEQRRWQGQADPPLSELGQRQALEAASRVGTVDVVVASPQQRAFGTASIIAEQIGVGPVETIEGLRERTVGPWSGLTHDEIDEQWPGWIEGGQRPDGWEYDDVVAARALAGLEEIHTRWPGASALVVAHGGVIITVEKHLGVNEHRIPNLHGRVVIIDGNGMRAGDSVDLVGDDMRTGGSSSRN